MPLMSRFRKKEDEQDDLGLEGLEEEDEEAGLLLSALPQEELPPASAEPEAAGGEPEDEAAALAEETPAEGSAPTFEVAAEGSPGGDDLLAAFRESTATTELADLAWEIEEVPIEELLREARDLHALLTGGAVEPVDAQEE